jgi:hypothetical protein
MATSPYFQGSNMPAFFSDVGFACTRRQPAVTNTLQDKHIVMTAGQGGRKEGIYRYMARNLILNVVDIRALTGGGATE